MLSGGSYTATTLQTGPFGFRSSQAIDGMHRYTLRVNAVGTSIRLGFGASLNQPIGDGSFGIDNVIVTSDADGGTMISTEDFSTVGGPENREDNSCVPILP